VGSLTIAFVANLSVSPTVKEFWKSIKIWQSYHHEFGGPVFFWNTVYIMCLKKFPPLNCLWLVQS